MRDDTELSIIFTAKELKEIIAQFFGYDEEDVNLNDYSEDYIKEIILEMIW